MRDNRSFDDEFDGVLNNFFESQNLDPNTLEIRAIGYTFGFGAGQFVEQMHLNAGDFQYDPDNERHQTGLGK